MWVSKSLLYFGIVLTIANTTWSINITGSQNSKKQISKNNVVNVDVICKDPVCKKEVNKILESVDYDVNPCDNFYNFTCGKFLKYANIPAGEKKIQPNNDTVKNAEDIRSLLEEDILNSDLRPFKLVKTYYKSCMNMAKLRELNSKPMQEIFTKLGGWPLLSKNWKDTNFNWLNLTKQIRNIGFDGMYIAEIALSIDLKNTTQYIITADSNEGGLLQKDDLRQGMKNKNVQEYFEQAVNLTLNFFDTSNISKTNLHKELKDAIEFEIKLANISLTATQKANVTLLNNPINVTNVSSRYKNFPWLEYINIVLEKNLQPLDKVEINVIDTRFFEQLGNLLKSTSKRTLANYLILRLFLQSYEFMEPPSTSTLDLHNQPRWQKCSTYVSQTLGIILGSMYVKKFSDSETKDMVTDMAQKVRDQLVETIKKSNWLETKTQDLALKKLKKINFVISHPEELANDTKIVNFYANLEDMKPEEFLQNTLKINKFTRKSNQLLKRSVKNSTWTIFGAIVADIKPYYAVLLNSIFIPAGYLRSKFNKTRPDSINYGTLGYLIGHELTHAIDDQGRKFDENGNLFNWWESKAEANFLKRTKCVVEFYNNFTEETTKEQVNGIQTLGENIADISGYKHAFFAFTKKISNNTEKLSGYDSNAKKLFWISSANFWCSVTTKEEIQNELASNEHTPDYFRVIGPFQNLKEFSTTFNCPSSSPMNATKKCVLW